MMRKVEMVSIEENDEKTTREKILDAIFALVYLHGYHGTSMSMILSACGIPKGSLYHHFSSKKEMILVVLKERILPRFNNFYALQSLEGEDGIDTIVRTLIKISSQDELVIYGCPLHRLNQEMAPLDEVFESEINAIYVMLRERLVALLAKTHLKEGISLDSLSEFIIATVWGNLSLSPKQSSKQRYLASIAHLIAYLKSLKA